MPRLNSIVLGAFAASVVTIYGIAAAQNVRDDTAARPRRPSAEAPQQAAPKMTTERLLALWERQSQRLETLQVAIYRIDKLPDWDEELHYEGTAKFKTPQLAYLDFKKIATKTQLVPDPKNPKNPKIKKVVDLVDPKTRDRASTDYERIVCTGKEVWHYRFDKRTAYIYTLNKNAQRRGLDEGPLPFLFNMKAEEALTRYQMALQGEGKDFFFVVIQPKLKEDAESFSTAFVRLDRTYLLPTRITLISPDKQSVRDFQLSKIAANQELKNDAFRGGAFRGWTVERNPTASEVGHADRAAPRQGRDGQPARQIAR
jgi:outer membrane lipoprotein-sorting protein